MFNTDAKGLGVYAVMSIPIQIIRDVLHYRLACHRISGHYLPTNTPINTTQLPRLAEPIRGLLFLQTRRSWRTIKRCDDSGRYTTSLFIAKVDLNTVAFLHKPKNRIRGVKSDPTITHHVELDHIKLSSLHVLLRLFPSTFPYR